MDSLSVGAPSFFKNLCSVPKLYKFPVGLDSPLIELKKRLIDNNTVVSLLVSAPPGCGKTTLVTHFCHDSQVKSKFKHILFNVVSSTPDFRRIVQNLLLHNGYATQTFENDTQATVALRNLLEELSKNGPVLLVLDDVWQGADSFLEKFRISIPDYKILVTSRSEFQGFDSTYYLKPLEGENARALLVQWASRPSGVSPAEYEYLLQMILKRCNGFPLVIVVIGRLLKGRSLSTWKKLVESWYQGETILDFPPQPSVLQRLKSSFNALDPNLKECFLDMGSFLEDQKIRASVIIDMWVELYGISSIILCKKYLEDLASHNLLKLVPLGNEHGDGFYYDYLVTQHSILRELAIRQSGLKSFVERKRIYLEIREDTFPDWCLNQREPIMINASILSISTDDSFSSNWVQMDCPNVEALILHYTSRNFALPSFIAGMKKLKVLIVTNHGPYRERLGNCSCLRLLPNLKRIRLSNQVWSAPDMPFDTSDLKQDSFPMNSQWKKGKLLGRGTYGSVYVATNTGTGALCAVKVVELYPDDLKSAECAKQLEQEIKLLSNLLHPNIVQYFGSETLEDRFFIYLEYVHPGSINKYIQDHCGGTMTESVVRNFTRHILSGLAYLHSKKTVHRDIKGANLLVDASGVVKLADFGLAKHLTGQRADLSSKGTPYWMAPELIQPEMQRDSNPDLAFAVDIWSLGCTIIEMFTGKHPWSELEWIAAMYKVLTESPPVPELMSPEGKDFLSLCFQRNPEDRPTASKLLKHQFLNNSVQPT